MRPILYAHRGAAAERPENTLPSFELALARGAGALEMDAHLTRDGHVVVAHDPDGARMCGVPVEIRRATLAEVQGWDAGHGFVADGGARPFAGQGLRIPTLAEVLRRFPDQRINIDVKQSDPPMVAPLLELLRGARAEERVTLASFRLATLVEVRRRGYRGATSLARAEVMAALAMPAALWRALPWTGSAAQIPTAAARLRLDTAAMIARFHDRGLRVDYWTINDPAEAARLLALGADGIMTDDPAAIAPVFAGLPR